MTDDPVCGLCPRTRAEHRQSELEGTVHHRFGEHGDALVRLDGFKQEKKGSEPAIKVMTGPPGDPILRTILIEKGVISLEDLEKAERVLGATGVLRNHGNPDVGH